MFIKPLWKKKNLTEVPGRSHLTTPLSWSLHFQTFKNVGAPNRRASASPIGVLSWSHDAQGNFHTIFYHFATLARLRSLFPFKNGRSGYNFLFKFRVRPPRLVLLYFNCYTSTVPNDRVLHCHNVGNARFTRCHDCLHHAMLEKIMENPGPTSTPKLIWNQI